jgi:NAD(P)-dependent dehydrogenase (short-subunit alcohol dehydrogenase family)
MSENKVALVTGVSSEISREIARRLAENGARVFETVRDIRSAAYIRRVELVRIAAGDELRAVADSNLRKRFQLDEPHSELI